MLNCHECTCKPADQFFINWWEPDSELLTPSVCRSIQTSPSIHFSDSSFVSVTKVITKQYSEFLKICWQRCLFMNYYCAATSKNSKIHCYIISFFILVVHPLPFLIDKDFYCSVGYLCSCTQQVKVVCACNLVAWHDIIYII